MAGRHITETRIGRRLSSDTALIEGAWHVVGDLYSQAVFSPGTVERYQIKEELLFCLLGGFGITYEHGRSACKTIGQLRPFSEEWTDQDLFEAILAALMRPQFEPRRMDGSFRRYRFPRQKASVIVKARKWVQSQEPLEEHLLQLDSAKDRRRFFCECPGVGFKTASWLLRNLGLGDELAIIDIHLLRALVGAKRVPDGIQIPKDYELAEEAFLAWCEELGAPSAAFDLFVWHWQRGNLVTT